MTEFVDGWFLEQTLGEGAYGEVKLVINRSTSESVAMKMIDLAKHPEAKRTVRKETAIHRMLSNTNIIQYFGQRSEPNMEYIFLEYASGGELFDRIEPDIGMSVSRAQKYFKQLISGVEYLHSRGVAHRDLKPENLLLDIKDNLKISDFGLATIYRMHGKERCLEKICGTLPYVAPEVLVRSYHAEPADIWSCGIILVALLAGELPWDQCMALCPEYIAWKNGTYMSLTPWKKLDNLSLSLLKNILTNSASTRYKIADIKQHRWFVANFTTDEIDGNQLRQVITENDGLTMICLSQPDKLPGMDTSNPIEINLDARPAFSFSQPAHMEDLLLCTQFQAMQYTQLSQQQNTFQRLVRRMTRFFVKAEFDEIIKRLRNYCERENYVYRLHDFGTITISTIDPWKMPLIFKVNLMEMDKNILMDFRLSKGCGLEFKRRFIRIKYVFEDIITKTPMSHLQ